MAARFGGGKPRERLPKSVIAFGWTSFFTDVSSEMIAPLLPFFLTSMLGGGALALGWVEGFADALSSVLKLVSGRLSDRFGRSRLFVLGGYVLSSIARPLVALAAAPWHVVAVRALDRTGKGLRTSPRDSIIAAETPAARRGEAFGFQRAMDHAGAVVGPLAAIALLQFATTDLRVVFGLAAIPGAIACAVIVLFVREPVRAARAPGAVAQRLGTPNRALLKLLVPLAIFTIGNASDLFLLLQLAEHDSGPIQLSLLWLGLHAVKAVSSFFGGRLSDRFGPLAMIASGWMVYAAVYLGLALAEDRIVIVSLCLAYGAYHGMTEGAEKALVSRVAPSADRGTAFGWYYMTTGLLALPASVIFGAVWSTHGSATAFGMGAVLAGTASAALLVLRPGRS
ncbi:MAG: MFS transporter [Planctomycetota bacterium]